jgi:hypothetical protein
MVELLTTRFRNSELDIYHSDVLKMNVVGGEIEPNTTHDVRIFDIEKIIKRPAYHLY